MSGPWQHRGFVILTVALCLAACSRRSRIPPGRHGLFAPLDTVTCSAFASLPPSEQQARHHAAGKLWHRFLSGEASRRRSRQPGNLQRGLTLLGDLLRIDPTRARAWYLFGKRLHRVRLDARARQAFRHCSTVLPCSEVAGADTLADRAVLEQAWLDYDTGDWDAGLARLDGRSDSWHWRTRHEARVLRGLLLAGAGRLREALALARRLPPTTYNRVTSQDGIGGAVAETDHWRRPARSGYAARWIQARAWLAAGSPPLARHALGHLAFTRPSFPYMFRYWNDVGMICEAAGDVATARLAYGLAIACDQPWRHGQPMRGFSCEPIIHGHPDRTIPCFTTAGDRYLAGSRFTLAAQLLAECAQATDSAAARRAGRRAVAQLNLCRRLGLHPLEALALRGRVHYYLGAKDRALADLTAARDSLEARGEPDAATSLVLGAILVDRRRPDLALPPLRECVTLEPTLAAGWRSLGAALSLADSNEAAAAAFDRALALEPGEASNWYNRGRLLAEQRRWSASLHDLTVADRLRPGDRRIVALLGQVTALMRRESGTDSTTARTADSLAATVAPLDSLTRHGTAPAAATPPEHRLATHPIPLPGSLAEADSLEREESAVLAARADSLAAAYTRHPLRSIRRRLAETYLALGRPRQALHLLTPWWQDGLSLPEQRLVLRSERELGTAERSLAAARALRGEPAAPPDDPIFWTLVSLNCLEQGEQELGLRALHRALTLDPENRGLRATWQLFTTGRDTTGTP